MMAKSKGIRVPRESVELDLHVLVQPEDDNMRTLYTVSVGRRAVCIDMPIEQTLESIREELESAESDQ